MTTRRKKAGGIIYGKSIHHAATLEYYLPAPGDLPPDTGRIYKIIRDLFRRKYPLINLELLSSPYLAHIGLRPDDLRLTLYTTLYGAILADVHRFAGSHITRLEGCTIWLRGELDADA
jgi:hypothetical protein